MSSHSALLVLAIAVAAPLLAEIEGMLRAGTSR